MKRKQQSSRLYDRDDFSAYAEYRTNHGAVNLETHHHEGFELLYLIEGETRILINGKLHRAVSGDLVVFHPRVVHEEQIQPGNYRIFCLRFPPEKIALPFPDEATLKPVVHLPWRERFHNVLEQIVLEKKGVDQWSDRMVGVYLMQFVVLLWRALSRYREEIAGTAQEHNLRISHVIDLIHARIDADVPLKDLASRAFMSESHFSHTFKEVTGLPPKRYMIGAKIGKARELLATTDKKVNEIARILGYESPDYFHRLFRKETGSTPLGYRRRSRNVQPE